MTAYPDPATDPTGYVLAVADQREQRAKAATPGPFAPCPWHRELIMPRAWAQEEGDPDDRPPFMAMQATTAADAEHIAAEANPGHALAEVALWRSIADRHKKAGIKLVPEWTYCEECRNRWAPGPEINNSWPCPDIAAVVAAAKAYTESTK